ncbi:hypothetical protein Sfulv_41560 [Streptomyces fulvorobeus]|uniref:Uncharacterized protein n=1 Tax=Streptomyces fulvorobeus TaxID=284028 RepID=A0A7J0C9X6_9ACTN|nr:hypothetical protein Sfulv_41560 [Streptomyces fulvorobeus]
MQAGPVFVAYITSEAGFRRRKWRETSGVPPHFGYATARSRPLGRNLTGNGTQNVPFRFELYVNLAAAWLPEE